MSKKISPEKRLSVFNKFNGKCAYCGIDVGIDDFHVDHFIARNRGFGDLSKRGSNRIDNLFPACQSCNCSKSNLSVDEFRNSLLSKHQVIYRKVSEYRILLKYGLITEVKKPILFYFEMQGVGNG